MTEKLFNRTFNISLNEGIKHEQCYKLQRSRKKIIILRGQKVILNSDVAELYGVETKRINEAVKNNPDKFLSDYIIELDKEEWAPLMKSKISTSLRGGKVKAAKAFTEKRLYMLATILKSYQTTKTTLAIIDTFSKVREMGQIVSELPTVKENSPKHGELLHRASDIISELVTPDKTESEACIELNFAIVKFKYTLKKKV